MSSQFERTRNRLRKLMSGEAPADGRSSSSIPELPAEAWNADYLRLMLWPEPGLAERLSALKARGVLALLLPDTQAGQDSDERVRAELRSLEQLLDESTLAGKRFGSLLRELRAADLLVLSLLLRDGLAGRPSEEILRAAQSSFDHLHLAADERRITGFLLQDDLRMSQMAFRPDADDPQSVEGFATYLNSSAMFNTFNTEEHLKMLCLQTLVTLAAEGALTPLRSELLWRFYVDTYNHVLKSYGDEVIEPRMIGRSALNSTRPADITEADLIQALEGLPKRYLTLFDPDHIYEHVRLCRNISENDVHFFAHRTGDVWDVTVATLDKPFLFSNICGVLSYFELDILDGQALTSTRGLVLDLFKVGDPAGVLKGTALEPVLRDVLVGKQDVESLLRSKQTSSSRPGALPLAPVIAFDNESSHRYTVLEIVARDATGLLYRISRTLSTFRCEIEMVVISTEDDKAVDVFHVKKDGTKLTDSDELPLTEALEEAIGLLA